MILTVGIVLYNPKIEQLKKSILNLYPCVNYLFLVDNGSNNLVDVKNLIQSFEKIFLIENKKNVGIAKALNQLLENANKKQSDYLLTLDQDSILKENDLKIMLKYINIKDIAIICPMIQDINKKHNKKQNEEVLEINRCITSGTLMNLKVCNKIGVFDEKMFIDYVDFDYCKRVCLAKKKILRVKNARISHEIGKRSKRKFLFWNVYPTNHNPKRIYYYSRNITYYCHKFKKEMSIKEKIIELKYLFWKLVSIVLYENDKKNKLESYFKGLKEGIKND